MYNQNNHQMKNNNKFTEKKDEKAISSIKKFPMQKQKMILKSLENNVK